MYFFRHGDRFYKQYINTIIRTEYLDDDGTGVKKIVFKSKSFTGKQYRFGYITGGEIWDRDMKKQKKILEEK